MTEHSAATGAGDEIERENKLQRLVARLRQEAECHAMEARTANASLRECYQVVVGATGEPGTWNGAEPIRKALRAKDAEIERLTLENGSLRSKLELQERGGVEEIERLWDELTEAHDDIKALCDERREKNAEIERLRGTMLSAVAGLEMLRRAVIERDPGREILVRINDLATELNRAALKEQDHDALSSAEKEAPASPSPGLNETGLQAARDAVTEAHENGDDWDVQVEVAIKAYLTACGGRDD